MQKFPKIFKQAKRMRLGNFKSVEWKMWYDKLVMYLNIKYGPYYNSQVKYFN